MEFASVSENITIVEDLLYTKQQQDPVREVFTMKTVKKVVENGKTKKFKILIDAKGWFDNGQLKYHFQQDDNGVSHGEQLTYFRDGTFVCRIVVDHGKKIEEWWSGLGNLPL